MTQRIDWPRFVLSLALGLPLTWLLAAQALSGVSRTNDPQLSVSILPSNGLAREQLAYQSLIESQVERGSEMPSPSRETIALAREALNDDPLVAKSHIVLALAQTDKMQRRKILIGASQLNRRDLGLQGLVLQEYIESEDYSNTMNTLDQILRVHPEYSREFFPILSDALVRPEVIPLFAEMLDGTSPWHERFLVFAVQQSALSENLAALRPTLKIQNDDFDRKLIAGLVQEGRVDRANAVYQSLSGSTQLSSSEYRLGWVSDYPPFDWQFVDEAGFRAQATRDGNVLELLIRPGKGGVFAERLLSVSEAPFVIKVTSNNRPSAQAKDVRLQLSCDKTSSPFFDQELQARESVFTIEKIPPGCEYVVLALWARAWSGGSNLEVELEEILISPPTTDR